MAHHGIGKFEPCPSLEFDDKGIAKCNLVEPGLVPVGDGCCIKARAYKDGKEFDFAGLRPAMKSRAVADLRRSRMMRMVKR